MADFNSVYTGAEIEAAIVKTDEIVEFVQVYSGSPTNSGVSMSSIPADPTTGLKTGVYDVIYASNTTDVDTSAGSPNLARIWIGDIGQNSGGSGHSDMDDTYLYVNSADYDGVEFTATSHTHAFSSGGSTDLALYIHKIFRLQKVQ